MSKVDCQYNIKSSREFHIKTAKQFGFTLIELMISLTLGIILSSAVVQVMISNNSTERLNRSLASIQENGRFIISRLRNDLIMGGLYDTMSISTTVATDTIAEAGFVNNNPVPVKGNFPSPMELKGAKEGGKNLLGKEQSDILMIVLQADTDCTGAAHISGGQYIVVNEYFLQSNSLKCRGFDGRKLLSSEYSANTTAYTLLDNVESFQVLYGVTDNIVSTDNSGRPIKFITAAKLPAEKNAGAVVVAIRIALLLKGDSDLTISSGPTLRILGENVQIDDVSNLYRLFETTITLRNSKNFVRSRNI